MKHILTFLLLLVALTVAGQDYSPCYTNNITKGDMAYNQGRYKDAKTYYENALKCPNGNVAEAKRKINQCNAKLNPPPKPQPQQQQQQQPQQHQPSASVPKTDQTFTVNGISFKMVYVQGGTFTMGCTSEQGGDCGSDETPIHSVTLSDFLIGETEVTQVLWEAVMGTTVREQRDKAGPYWPMRGEGANYPMYYVSWNEAVVFCNKLNEKLRSQLPSGCRFTLPTEAQWEYAARGGNKSRHYKYVGGDIVGDVAWYTGNSDDKTHPVKTKKANELGLYDMSGNVWEWCSDWYGSYSSSSQTNPKGPSSGSSRVLRGGSWGGYAWFCRVSDRSSDDPDDRYGGCGLRLSLVRQ